MRFARGCTGVGAVLAGVSVFAVPARAEDATDAAAATAPGRSLDRALDMALGRTAVAAPAQRAFVLLVDPTKNLRDAAFSDRLASALERKAKSAGIRGADRSDASGAHEAARGQVAPTSLHTRCSTRADSSQLAAATR